MSGGQNNQNAMHELKTSEPAESAVRSIGIVVPPRRKYSPLIVGMMAAASMGVMEAMRHEKGCGVLIVDDDDNRVIGYDPQLTAADKEALEKAKAKRERKALAKEKRHNGEPSQPASTI